jgi:hypothetical protein
MSVIRYAIKNNCAYFQFKLFFNMVNIQEKLIVMMAGPLSCLPCAHRRGPLSYVQGGGANDCFLIDVIAYPADILIVQ